MHKIVLIEDEPQVRENIQEILELNNFEVKTACNGKAGLALVDQESPALIICDLMMPELDGYGVLQALRQDPATAFIPFIFLTACSDRKDMRLGMNLGADDYLTKPCEPKELLQAIKARLRKQDALIQHYVSKIQDVESQLNHTPHHDLATDLPNLMTLREELENLKQLNTADSSALIFVWIENFRDVRSSLGHSFSNLLLKTISNRLSQCCAESNIKPTLIAHIETDLFVVLVKIQRSETVVLAQNIVENLRQSYHISNHVINLQASVKSTFWPEDGLTLESLLDSANVSVDADRKTQKSLLTSKYPYHSSNLNFSCLSLESDLRKAIAQDELSIYYQPQLDLRTGKICGAEALLRWRHPERGFVSPAEFIPLAEESNLILLIGDWVLHHVAGQLKQWQMANLYPGRVAINLSAQQFRYANLSSQILNVCQSNHLDPSMIDIELTESILVTDVDLTTQTLRQLKDLGVGISIDDFGTGYSSLSYLQRFPFDILKIDQSFVKSVNQNSGNKAIVDAIIQMSHGLNLLTIAEGVESADELEFLRSRQCDSIQGYLFSPPIPADQFYTFIVSQIEQLQPQF